MTLIRLRLLHHGRRRRRTGLWVHPLTCTLHARILAAMDTTIQIRRVPRHVHRRLAARAAHEGLSLSEFMLREAEMIARRLTVEEIRERISKLSRIATPDHVEDMIRRDRSAR